MTKFAAKLDGDGYVVTCWTGADKHDIPAGKVPITQVEAEMIKGKKEHEGSEIRKYKYNGSNIVEEADPREIGTWSDEEIEMDVGDPFTDVTLTLSSNYTGSDYEIVDNHHRSYTPIFTNGVATLTFTTTAPGEIEIEKSNDITFTNKIKVKVKGGDEIEMPEPE